MPLSSEPSADIAVVVDRNLVRVEAAISLLNSGKVEALYVNTFSKDQFENLLKTYNLPRSKVYWGGCRTSTTYAQPFFFVQAYQTYKMADYDEIVLVSSPYHLRRSLWSYQHVLSHSHPSITIKTHAAYSSRFQRNSNWWEYDYGRVWVIEETQKNIFYRIYYGLLNQENIDIPFNNLLSPSRIQKKGFNYNKECGDDYPPGASSPPIQKLPSF